ncbi:hypothetical protein [Streptomyces griseoluteus]|uniref:hypothetical protein n=1 Tax=Streptomyces griseoluteus TaxID=29306 RepID=UPI0037F5FD06
MAVGGVPAAETAREKIAELTALLDGLGRVTEEIRITRKTLLELPDPRPPAPPTAKLPDHPAYHQIMAVFATADAPLRARAVCEAMDMEIAPNNIKNVRLKLKRWSNTESWSRPSRACSPSRRHSRPANPRPGRSPQAKGQHGHQPHIASL